jgi:hypothetical protein
MRTHLLPLALWAAAMPAMADDSTESLRRDMDTMSNEYQQQINELQQRINDLEQSGTAAGDSGQSVARNTYNPAISLIFNGAYSSYELNPEQYDLPGFQLGDEAGLGPEGFSIGESELNINGNIDNLFFGNATIALEDANGELEVALEEAYVETLGLGYGTNVKAGRFYSDIGYLNKQHPHAWDFYDAPLIYRGLFGDQLVNDGVQFSVLVPTDLFLKVGTELGNGGHFPSGEPQSGIGNWDVFAKVGGDIGISHSWQAAISYWYAPDVQDRMGINQAYEGETLDTAFSGTSKIAGMDFVYKWAPRGNPEQRNFKFQFEYFHRDENGDVSIADSDPLQTTSYSGTQHGWYAQGIYQFVPQWATGLRYDRVSTDNEGSNEVVLEEAGMSNAGYVPERYSAMLQWMHSEYSRIRFQYNLDRSTGQDDNQFFVQYTFVLGAHGAHTY